MSSALRAGLLATSLIIALAPAAHAALVYEWTTTSVVSEDKTANVNTVSLGTMTLSDDLIQNGRVQVHGSCDNPAPGCTSTIGDISQVSFTGGFSRQDDRVGVVYLDIDVILNTDGTLTGGIAILNRALGLAAGGDGYSWSGYAGVDSGDPCFYLCQYTGYWLVASQIPEPPLWPSAILFGAGAIALRRWSHHAT